MILENRFVVTARLDAKLEKKEKEGVAYLRLVPSDWRRPQGTSLPKRMAHRIRSTQAGLVMLWLLEICVFMVLPAMLIIAALHPQLFCVTGCVTNGMPLP